MTNLPWEVLRQVRQERGLSQAALADCIVSQSMLCHIEQGRIMPSEPTLRQLAQRLELDVDATLVAWRAFRRRSRLREELWQGALRRAARYIEEMLEKHGRILIPFEFHVYDAFCHILRNDVNQAETSLFSAWGFRENPSAKKQVALEGGSVGLALDGQAWLHHERLQALVVEAMTQETICVSVKRQLAVAWWADVIRERTHEVMCARRRLKVIS